MTGVTENDRGALRPRALTIDMRADDEPAIRHWLLHEVPDLIDTGVRSVVLELGDRTTVRNGVKGALADAHHTLRAVNGRLVVVTSPAIAIECARACPDLLVAATTRQALAALGIAADVG